MLFGLFPSATRWFAVGTFVVFAAVSGMAGWAGQSDCGCFGRLAVNPWAVFALDATAIILLVACRPRKTVATPRQWQLIRIAMVSLFAFNGVLAWYAIETGSLSAGMAVLRGEELTADPALLNFGDQLPGQTVEKTVRLTNHSRRTVRVVGGTSDCRCIATDDLPATLEPGASTDIRVRLSVPESPGRFGRTVWLWSDTQKRLKEFELTGVVVYVGTGR